MREFLIKHFRKLLLGGLALFNFILWAVPSNLAKLTVKGKPIFLDRYSLERLTFLFIMIPVSLLLVYLIFSTKENFKKRLFAVITIVIITVPGLFLLDLCLRFMRQSRYVQTDHVYHRPPSKTYTVQIKDKPKTSFAFPVVRPGYPTEPCTLTTDKNGFRNKNLKEKYDIVVIGDSFTEGTDVSDEKIWPYLLEKGTGMSVCNLGMSGTDPLDYWLTLEKFGLKLSPKIIVCMLYEGNDFRDQGIPGDRIRTIKVKEAESGNSVVVKRPDTFSKKLRRYRKNSPLLQAFRKLFSKYFILGKKKKDDDTPKSEVLSWLPVGIPETGNTKYYFFKPKRFLPLYKTKEKFLNTAGWKSTAASLRRINKTCKKHNIKLIVNLAPCKPHVIFPLLDKNKLSAPQIRKYASMRGKNLPPAEEFLEAVYTNLPNQEAVLSEFCSNEGIDYVSTTQVLRKNMADGTQVYFTYDQHWSPDGHKVVADKIAEYIQKTDKKADEESGL